MDKSLKTIIWIALGIIVLALLFFLLASLAQRGVSNNSSQEETIRITTNGFDPNKLEVQKGTLVKWDNQDSANHTIVSDQFPGSETLAPGGKYEYKFENSGNYKYSDVQNTDFTGEINVK